jgi:hypothetical protein
VILLNSFTFFFFEQVEKLRPKSKGPVARTPDFQIWQVTPASLHGSPSHPPHSPMLKITSLVLLPEDAEKRKKKVL